MKIAMIAAMANNRIIGKDNQMPWHLPADLKFFKQTTLGKPVVMGRRTYESIGRPLPGRLNIVISRDDSWQAAGVTCVTSPEAALELLQDHDEIMVLGGGAIYQAFLPLADTLYLTFIQADIAGDTQFPDYEAQGNWQSEQLGIHPADEKNQYDLVFTKWARLAQ
ncbi:type 3 dihydrofolate reductase [Motilimonas cestriensis]|uniref:Dihydrofolate reductase n=1 Tax=Motilimonas cestriensis TaxID=2742685 RepID=A0ABS8W853_9GAMM|nr:type 3 dihydrofolate reductase [Motilimonas cestriensis]MCE2595177.1 type 3 dihydrofolate reductase [Motilimonas cestriensis]